MPRATPSLARAEMLKWARQACTMTADVVAKKLDIEVSRLLAWEAGEPAPTIPQLRHLADIYKRPLSFFYLPRPPQEAEAIAQYRSRSKQGEMTPELYNELRGDRSSACCSTRTSARP